MLHFMLIPLPLLFPLAVIHRTSLSVASFASFPTAAVPSGFAVLTNRRSGGGSSNESVSSNAVITVSDNASCVSRDYFLLCNEPIIHW